MPPTAAHTLRPAIATLALLDSGRYELLVELNLEALITGIGPQHADSRDAPQAADYDRLRAAPPEDLRAAWAARAPGFLVAIAPRFDGRTAALPEVLGVAVPAVGDTALARNSTLRLGGSIPVAAGSVAWALPAAYGSAAFRVRYGDGPVVRSYWLTDGKASPAVGLDARVVPRARGAVALDYLGLGFTHILPLGLDHILFVLGIFLLSLRLAPLLWQVTAFTVAHTLTLGLSMYGIVALPVTVVEPLIALSIVYVGVENVLTVRLHRWRVALVFTFGLLHGLGFAGVLTAIGLPPGEFVTALVAFNIGVEGGQLAVIALALVAVGAFRARPWYRRRIVIPASLAIAATGLYWTVERLS